MIPLFYLLLMLFAIGPQGPSVRPPDNFLKDWESLVADGQFMYEDGRVADATRDFEKAVHCANHFEPLDPRLPETLHLLAFLYREQGRFPEAENLYLRAIDLWQKLGDAQHVALSQSTDDLIGTYMLARDFRAAKRLMLRRLPELERSAVSSVDRGVVLGMRASLAAMDHRYSESERLYRLWLAGREQYAPGHDRDVAVTLMDLSEVFVVTKRPQQGLDVMLQALEVLGPLGAPANALLLRALDSAAFLCVKLRRYEEAEGYYRRALTTARQAFGIDNSMVGQLLLRHAAVLQTLRRKSEAEAASREGLAVLRRGRPTVDILGLTPAR